MSLLSVRVALGAEAVDISSIKQILVVGRVRLMAILAVFKGRLVLEAAGESFSVVACQADRDPVLNLQILSVAYMGTMTFGATLLHGAVNDGLAHLRGEILVAVEAQIRLRRQQFVVPRLFMALAAVSRLERGMGGRQQQPFHALLTHMRRMAVLAVRLREVETMVVGSHLRRFEIVALAAQLILGSHQQRRIRSGVGKVTGYTLARLDRRMHRSLAELILKLGVTAQAEGLGRLGH